MFGNHWSQRIKTVISLCAASLPARFRTCIHDYGLCNLINGSAFEYAAACMAYYRSSTVQWTLGHSDERWFCFSVGSRFVHDVVAGVIQAREQHTSGFGNNGAVLQLVQAPWVALQLVVSYLMKFEVWGRLKLMRVRMKCRLLIKLQEIC